MKPLVVITVLLSLNSLSTAQSAENTDEEDNKPRLLGCISRPRAPSDETTQKANQTAAVLRARCYSVCLEKDHLGTDKLLLMQEPHVTMSEYKENCTMYMKIEKCVRGCLLINNSSPFFCPQESHVSECCSVNISECTFFNQTGQCDSGYTALITGSDSLQVPLQPFIHPTLQLVKSSSDNATYTVNISETDLDRVRNSTGSGNIATLNASPVTFIFQIKNNQSYRYIVLPGLPETITFYDFICKEVEVRFALVNQHGISGFSPPFNMHIQGDIVSPPEPVDLASIVIQSVYDYRHGYFGHANLNITWENPPNISYISHYKLEMVGPQLQNCGSANYSWIKPSLDVRTTKLVFAESPTDPPFLGCYYQIKIQSVSLSTDFFPANTTWNYRVKESLYNLPPISLHCERRLEINTFVITTIVNISQYLANENVIAKLVFFPTRVEYTNPSKTDVRERKHLLLLDRPLEVNQSVIKTIMRNQPFEPLPDSNHDYEISVHATYRADTVFTPIVATAVCKVDAQALRPDQVTNIQLLDKVERLGMAQFIVSLQWSPPVETNGQMSHYNVCVGTAPLNPSDPLPSLQCSATGDCYACTPANPTAVNMTWNVFQLFPPDTEFLYLQVRSNNIYRPGHWSNSSITISLVTTTTTAAAAATTTLSTTSTSVLLVSFSPAQTLSPAVSVNVTAGAVTKDQTVVISASVGGVLCVPLAVMAALFILCIHWKMRQRKRQLEFIQETNDDPVFRMGPRKVNPLFEEPGLTTDDWEIPASQVIIDESLGEGAFGEVYKGIITEPINNPKVWTLMKQNCSSYVAVKLLKTSASGNERTDFLSEIEMMKRIAEGNNPHVVNLIGCVTIQEPLCLITEFVKYGDLQSYLRTNRRMATDRQEEAADGSPYSDLGELTSVDLISFAYQIASGMEFLASLGIVHRDLAARNILIGEGKSLKISDFGMARDVGTGADDVYVKTTRGRLPLKWMAIESIVDREFTMASDVWAYGITLWEIGTLGGFPYPAVPNDMLVSKLKQGYRMEQPDNCSPEIYDIMLECWAEAPKKRPTFTQLRAKFDSLLTAQQCSNPYIDLRTDEHKDYYNLDLIDDDSRVSGRRGGTEEEKIKSDEEEKEEEDDEIMVTESTSLHTPERICKTPDGYRSRKSPSHSYLSMRASLSPYPSSPSRLKRSPSPSKSTTSGHSHDIENSRLQVTNPWISDGDIGYTTLTPAHPFNHSPRLSRPARPTSVTLWTEGRHNEYVDEPSLHSTTLIQVVPSTPPTPQSEPTDRLLGLASSPM